MRWRTSPSDSQRGQEVPRTLPLERSSAARCSSYASRSASAECCTRCTSICDVDPLVRILDWPAVVVWLGCAFSGRRRESASEYRRFPRRSADVAHPTPSSPTIQQTSNRFRGLSRQPPPGKKRRLDFPASTVGGRPGGRNFCEMIVNVSESHGNI